MTNLQLTLSGAAFGVFAGVSAFLWMSYGDEVTLTYLAGALMQCF